MSSSYVIEIEVFGLDPEAKNPLASVHGPKLVDSLVRDDGTGILWFEFDPPADEDGAKTWDRAKDYVGEVRSAVVGSDVGVLSCNVVLHDLPERRKASAKSASRA